MGTPGRPHRGRGFDVSPCPSCAAAIATRARCPRYDDGTYERIVTGVATERGGGVPGTRCV